MEIVTSHMEERLSFTAISFASPMVGTSQIMDGEEATIAPGCCVVSSSHVYLWFVVSVLLFALVGGCTQAKERSEDVSDIRPQLFTLVVMTPTAPRRV